MTIATCVEDLRQLAKQCVPFAHSVHFVAEGVITESGTPENIFSRPESEPLTSFIRTVTH